MFSIFATRALSEDCVGKRKLQKGKCYYLLNGFDISSDSQTITVNNERLKYEKIYNNYIHDVYDINENPHIVISAIVGENGAGKSSVIEFMMRIINNFAAATIGEEQINIGAAHLHFIDKIEGEFFFILNNTPYRILNKQQHITLQAYTLVNDKDGFNTYNINKDAIFDNELSDEKTGEAGRLDAISRPEFTDEKLSEIYSHLFYTLVCNYSIYAYNTNDFRDESNLYTLIRKVNKEDSDENRRKNEWRNWLHGIFHKNDGYQTPLVLTPMRKFGNIDINNEITLGKERLLSLLVVPHSYFRCVNGHLQAKYITVKRNKKVYDETYINNKLSLQLTPDLFQKIKERVISYLSENLNTSLHHHSHDVRYFDIAGNYLVYKIFRISMLYRRYGDYYKKVKKSRTINENALRMLIEQLCQDRSHITKKIRRILAYILYSPYNLSKPNMVDAYGERIEELYQKSIKEFPYLSDYDDFAPASIFDVDIAFQDKYTKDTGIMFSSLSSGEKQQIFSISSILYHLANINSVHKEEHHDVKTDYDNTVKSRITYSNIAIVLEEVELYYHPELQKNLITNILDGIKQLHLNNINGIHIILVTHSPFILSDIPSKNIMPLVNNPGKIDETKKLLSFGANIHDLLAKSFFLANGSIGDYAQWLINVIVICLNIYSSHENAIIDEINKLKEAGRFLECFIEDGVFNFQKFSVYYTKDHIKELIKYIDEPVLYRALCAEYNKVFSKTDSRKIQIQQQIEQLQKELESL